MHIVFKRVKYLSYLKYNNGGLWKSEFSKNIKLLSNHLIKYVEGS